MALFGKHSLSLPDLLLFYALALYFAKDRVWDWDWDWDCDCDCDCPLLPSLFSVVLNFVLVVTFVCKI